LFLIVILILLSSVILLLSIISVLILIMMFDEPLGINKDDKKSRTPTEVVEQDKVLKDTMEYIEGNK
jgi:hypothetical protein